MDWDSPKAKCENEMYKLVQDSEEHKTRPVDRAEEQAGYGGRRQRTVYSERERYGANGRALQTGARFPGAGR